jgi:LysM repeat protein
MMKLKLKPGLMCAFAVFLCACNAPPATATPTPPMLNLQTRIAATLASIPTAANLTPRAPTVTAQPAQSATPEPAVATPTPDPAASASDYVVQPGDTLSIIAQKFDTSMAALQLLNNIDDARLVRAGQRLKIPTAKLAPDENTFWIVYVVQPNETFGEIALRFGVQLNDLLRVNNITNPALVRAGQRLIIPLRAPA